MSQSIIQDRLPDGSPLKPQSGSWLAAVLRTGLQWVDALDRILRGEVTRPHVLRKQSIQIPLAGMSLLILLLALSYGFCMGMYPGCREQDPSYLRWLSCTLKIPALFFLTLCVTFPSLYVVNALVGSRLRLPALLKLLIAALAVNLAVLASAGPIVAFFSFSTTNSPFMVLLNVLVFGVSGLLGMSFLLQTLHRLSMIPPPAPPAPPAPPGAVRPSAPPAEGVAAVDVERTLLSSTVPADVVPPVAAPPAAEPQSTSFSSNYFTWPESSRGEGQDEPSALDVLEGHVLGRHVKTVFWCWTLIFGVVGAQMAWVLRPYFGSPGEKFVWFASRSSNFFEGVWHAAQQVFQ